MVEIPYEVLLQKSVIWHLKKCVFTSLIHHGSEFDRSSVCFLLVHPGNAPMLKYPSLSINSSSTWAFWLFVWKGDGASWHHEICVDVWVLFHVLTQNWDRGYQLWNTDYPIICNRILYLYLDININKYIQIYTWI